MKNSERNYLVVYDFANVMFRENVENAAKLWVDAYNKAIANNKNNVLDKLENKKTIEEIFLPLVTYKYFKILEVNGISESILKSLKNPTSYLLYTSTVLRRFNLSSIDELKRLDLANKVLILSVTGGVAEYFII